MPEPYLQQFRPGNVRAEGSTILARNLHFENERRNGEKTDKFNLGLRDDDDLPPYIHQDYPKAMYLAGGEEPIVVANKSEELEKLDEGYYSSLAEAQAAEAGPEHAMPARGAGGKFLKKGT